MSYTYLQEQGEESSVECFSDIPQSVLLRLNHTAEKSSCSDNETTSCLGSQSGMTSEPLMGSLGEELSMLCVEDSLVKILVVQEAGKDLVESEADSGWRWQGSLAKYDRRLRLWKTRQCSLFEESTEFLETWPRWGLMHDGELFPLLMLEHDTSVKGFGSWPTPTKSDGRIWVSKFVSLRNPEKSGMQPSEIHPMLHELLMGWPIGWSALQPLVMDKFLLWQQAHGEFYQGNK